MTGFARFPTRRATVALLAAAASLGCGASGDAAPADRTIVVRNASAAMEPTLRVGQEVVVTRWLDDAPTPPLERGMLVMYAYPEDTTRRSIKRVAGLPGDTLEMRRGLLHVDGRPRDTPHARFASDGADARRNNWGSLVVPSDSVFVLGDNRDASLDSRYWGYLPIRLVLGRVTDTSPSTLDGATGRP